MGDSGGSSIGLLSLGATSGVRASRFRLGFLKIRRPRDLIRWRSCVDLKSEVFGVRGDRVSISGGRKEGSWNLWWSRSGEKLDLGFQGKGKKSNFYLNRALFPVDCSST